MKFIASLFVAALAVLGLGACGAAVDSTPHSATGTYVYTNDGSAFVGEVTGGTITINMRGRDDVSLYWAGTFADTIKDGDKVNSVANREQLDASMTGSMDDNKTFTIVGDKIVFEMSALGTTKTIELEKNSSSTN